MIPTIKTINDRSKRQMYTLGVASLDKLLQKNKDILSQLELACCALRLYFGTTTVDDPQRLAR